MKQPMKDSAELEEGVEWPFAPNSLAMWRSKNVETVVQNRKENVRDNSGKRNKNDGRKICYGSNIRVSVSIERLNG